ncbi:MAG: hypothetical protein DCC65_17790 [Planctomycetota bacterium]|nr:MAG: hypothetical protein DCC65_17790 [Planctomycetota bacterium]
MLPAIGFTAERGTTTIMTYPTRRFSLFTALVLLAATGRAAAQDPLVDQMKSPEISARQRATMEAEVSLRVKRLKDAGTNADLRDEAKSRILRTATVEGATKAALDVYAEICANELTSLITGDTFETASEGVLILMELDNPATTDALIEGLGSKHAGVRLMAARAIQKLHAKLGNRSRAVLRALGRAGARESDEFVLRVIYQAIDFKADVRNFKAGDAAEALAMVLEARAAQLSGGSRDETRDEVGVEAAARCYEDASAGDKARLIGAVAIILESALSRYFDPDTAPEFLATLSRYIARIEEVIVDMAKASGVNLSCDRLKLNPRATDKKKQQADSEKVLDCIRRALAGDPWKIG